MGFKIQNWFRRRRSREEKSTNDMVLTVTEDTPADMLTGSMELLVLLPREHQIHTQKVTVERSTAMMDLLVQISTSHKLAASSYTLQAIGERGLVLPHQPNTPIGALDALQVKLLPKQGTFIPHKMKQANQPFETTFRLQVHLPRNQLYVSRVSPKMNLGEILEEVCREKNLDRNKYELRHPGNHEEKLDLSLSLEDYHLQEVTLYAKQGEKKLGSALSSQDIMALQRQEERRRHQAKQSVFGFMFRSKTKDNSLSNDSIGGRSISPARSDETGRSISPLALPPPTRPQRKRRQAPLPPTTTATTTTTTTTSTTSSIKQQDNIIQDNTKLVINHSRNSSDSSGYHEASVLSDHPDSTGRMPETLPRRSKPPGKTDVRKLGQTSLSSKSMSNLAMTTGGLSHSTSTTSISSTGIRKKRAAPAPPPINRPLSSAISTQALERIDDSEESLTSDIEISKPSSDIAVSSGNENDFNTKIKLHSTPIDKLDNYCSNNNKNINNKMKINTLVDDNVKSSSNNHDACHINVDTACFDKKDKDEQPSKTDILLQKVSTTLATTVVPSANNHDDNDDNLISSSKKSNKTNDVMIDKDKICETSNSTFNSQQDTSDYVSATGEDLSGTDWEYQLPDPPSAFRDNSSPDSYGYDTITLGSVEAFKEPIIIIDKKDEKLKNEVKEIVNEKSEIKSIVLTQNVDKKCHKQTDDMLRKNIIMELETKIENNCLNQNKINDCQSKIDDNKISNISPVDNTLSNFTITTYSKQKNNNIFKSNDDIFKSNDQNNMYNGKLLQNKTATLPTKNYYNKSNNNSNESSGINRTQSVKTTSQNDNIEFRKKVFKNNNEQDAKKNVYRSKSYIVLSNNSKYRDDKIEDVVDDGVVMRSTSFTNLNQDNSNNFNDNNHDDDDRNNSEIKNEKETTSQCQNEISKELQSVQILKSILPQLKNSQKTEDKISQKILEKRITEESESVNENKKNQSSDLKKNKPESDDASKKYRYTGPPTINLGSWSERPSVNVQIKHDNDYNIGQKNIIKNNNTSTGSKTIVNLNTSSNDVEIINYKDTYKNLQPKNNELKNIDLLNKNIYTNKNLINGIFKLRTISDNNNNKIDENIINDDKINKLHNTNDDDDVKIDTRPVNFKELTQTFGKINLRNKTNNNYQQNRHSDYFDNRLKNDSIIKSSELNKLPIKKYTSVVGINTQNTNCELLNNNNNVYNSGTKMRINNSSMTKLNGCVMPVVKGFKNDKDNDESCTSMKIKINNSTGATSSSSSSSSGVATTVSPSPPPPPQPPTMPIITGVTLKNSNTRPKSMPICQDPRDELLDSIRNFGRNNKLKSINAFS
ncbi:GATA zinc finger domain-containing protein 14-like isoform X3 [Aphidius gifuensis]|uniref:GATA zinc finger domain-containing protein 14-like isoform X3 n=1 Tax=Aphidius gifuensis TaxID=684658 RepID=UPI001CDD448D|nr:GATA zinc finger domain-containing protein 14-like isoform X3 [Aphidius gifuensis]